MISEQDILEQIPYALKETDLPLGSKTVGKVRDTYVKGDKVFLVTTDRISAFDRVLGAVPFKGQVLNQISAYWFEQTKDIIANHVVEVPDPNVMVARKVDILPIEVVIRGFLTGSAWRDVKAGRPVSGVALPKGLKKDQRFAKPLFTPSTKEGAGHDVPISEEEIIDKGIIEKDMLLKIKQTALRVFERGQQLALERGMILVDTKYEFGLDAEGRLVLADELHTPDSSRYWYADTYKERFAKGEDQRMLDKEYVRGWLMREKGFQGDGEVPTIPDTVLAETARRYIAIYEFITGRPFEARVGDVAARIKSSLSRYL